MHRPVQKVMKGRRNKGGPRATILGSEGPMGRAN